MTAWGEAPWSLRAYVVFTLVYAVIVAILVSSPVLTRVMLVALAAVVSLFLLRRLRWLWIVVIVLIPLSLALGAVEGNLSWNGVLASLVGLVLLLHPDTRRFYRDDVPMET